MLRYNNPFIGRYLRYVVTLLVLGILVPVVLVETQLWWSLISIIVALLITFGWDTAMYQLSKYKAEKLTKEGAQAMLPAIMPRADWKGFLVMTESYILFVPHMHKTTFITEWKDVHSFDVEGGYMELLYKQAFEKRCIHFIIASPAKVREEFGKRTNEARLEVEM
ncbi:hypothetical protein [Alkalicoccus daliensis]|uniref:Uncharacterized protein n=1 Tax=Alkalicoccus daliensis TaxID=745820 RepID=A0A1H0K4W4_9BACI|nr:hypothetical protein [Alkalicoccus daliensis]SDO50907.1 hypothetical protein SAMN04488053_11612 [Alkalicoccus daliensis]